MKTEFRKINWRGIKPFKIRYSTSETSYTDVDERIHHLQIGFIEFRITFVGKGVLSKKY